MPRQQSDIMVALYVSLRRRRVLGELKRSDWPTANWLSSELSVAGKEREQMHARRH